MSQSDPQAPQPSPWDRLGAFFGDVGATSSNIAARNMKLWMNPTADAGGGSGRAGGAYDWSRWMETATENTRDIWALWLGLPPSTRVAYPLPTVYLEFTPRIGDDGLPRWMLAEQVWIPVAWAAATRLPEFATVDLVGGDTAGATAVAAGLRVRLAESRVAYVLESYRTQNLVPGAYDGVIYLDNQPRDPIAALRVVVHDSSSVALTPAVPTIHLRWAAGSQPGPPQWLPRGPIRLRAPADAPSTTHPAEVALAGRRAAKLAGRLRFLPADGGQSYLLQAGDPPKRAEGFYHGSVHTTGSEPRTLAHLHVVVEPGADAEQ